MNLLFITSNQSVLASIKMACGLRPPTQSPAQDEAWYLLDDARSIPVSRDDALRVEAYIAFYRRVTAVKE